MKHPLTVLAVLAACCLLPAGPGRAQISRLPLSQTAPAAPTPSSARTQAVALPFFDDFSTYSGRPDPALWRGGGTLVNNTFSDNPPSKGFATFDGLRTDGTPYTADPTVKQAPTDTLASQPVDLAGLSPSSNVLLSFWWTAQSFGETPDPADSLVLQFLDRDGNWIRRWSAVGRNSTGAFRDTLLQVNESRFLHAAFQFQFVAFGRPSGLYDTWSVDYVILDKNPAYDARNIRDVAATRQPRPVLKRYSAMPLDQFLANPAAELGTADTTGVYNQEKNFNFFGHTYTLTDTRTNQVLHRYQAPLAALLNARSSLPAHAPLPAALPVAGGEPAGLRAAWRITTDPVPVIPGVDLTRNDTISRTTVLADYYAYDDGTAEYGAGIGQRLGSVAVRYVLNQPDTLTAVRLHFAHVGDRDLSGQTFVLTVWKRLDGRRESVLFQKAYPIRYPRRRDGFENYLLTAPNDTARPAPIAVSDTIYVGWTLSSNDLLAVGYDRNTDSRAQQFYNISGSGPWQPNTERLGGSLMLRPVFGAGVVTATEPPAGGGGGMAGFKVHPNPAADRLHWNTPGVRRVTVRTLQGRILLALDTPPATRELDTSGLPAGMYLFTFQVGPRPVVRRVAVVR